MGSAENPSHLVFRWPVRLLTVYLFLDVGKAVRMLLEVVADFNTSHCRDAVCHCL